MRKSCAGYWARYRRITSFTGGIDNADISQYKTNSNAAPFFSDPDSGFIKADNPDKALSEVVANYSHPMGLFAAAIFEVSPENKKLREFHSKEALKQRSNK